jgi:hypothetical protein
MLLPGQVSDQSSPKGAASQNKQNKGKEGQFETTVNSLLVSRLENVSSNIQNSSLTEIQQKALPTTPPATLFSLRTTNLQPHSHNNFEHEQPAMPIRDKSSIEEDPAELLVKPAPTDQATGSPPINLENLKTTRNRSKSRILALLQRL